ERAHTVHYAVRINTLEISVSERAPAICAGALTICGMAGYKNDSPFSVGRQLRDALSGGLMIANERIHATNAALLLVHKGECPASWRASTRLRAAHFSAPSSTRDC